MGKMLQTGMAVRDIRSRVERGAGHTGARLSFVGAGLLIWVIMGSSHAEINSPRGEHSVAPRADLLELRNAAAMPTAPAGMTVSALTELPLRFEQNLGQTDPSVKFVCRAPNYTAFITPSETDFVVASSAGGAPLPPGPGLPNPQQLASTSVTAAAVRLRLAGGAVSPVVSGSGKLIAPSNFLLGNNSSQWLSGVPQFSRVDFLQVYPGIDMSYYGDQNLLKSQFVVHAGTNPGNITLSFEGADTISLDSQGNLVLSTSAGNILFQAPHSYQMVQGSQQPVGSRYVIGSDNGVSFQVDAFDPSIDLIIDPAVSYVVVIGGGSGTDSRAFGVAVDSAGNAYFAGYTTAPDFPVTSGALQTTPSTVTRGFVAKVNPTGTALLYSTYLGGTTPTSTPINPVVTPANYISGIAVNAQGNVFVTGNTTCTDFPTLNAAQPTNNGTTSAFVTELSPDGSSMVFSTFLGGSGHAFGAKVALDPLGNVYVAGETLSANFPTKNAYQTGFVSIGAFVTKYSPSGAVVYSTLIGNESAATSLAVDAAGSAYITGWFLPSTNAFYPTTPGAFQTVLPPIPSPPGSTSPSSIFVTKLSPAGNSLVYSTFLATGNGWTKGNDIALDSTGAVYVTGAIDSPTFPTTPGAFQPQLTPPATVDSVGFNASDAFLTKLSPDGSSLIYSTFLGGNLNDQGLGVSVDPSGNAWIVGTSFSPDFPILNPLLPATTFTPEAFVSKFSATGSLLFSSNLLGISAVPQSVTTDSSGSAYVVGFGSVTNTTLNVFPPGSSSGDGAFLVKLSPTASASEITVITDSNGLAVSPPVLLPTTAGPIVIGVSVPGSTVSPVTFTVTALDPAVVTSIAAPVISSPSSGVYLTTATPLISGTSSGPGLTLTLLSGGVPYGTTTTGTGGAWSLTPNLSLGMGAQVLTAYLSDGAGNTSPASNAVAVTINTQPPVITTTFPVNETTTNLKPILSARWSDAVSGVVLSSVVITLDGVNVTSSAIITPGGFTLIPAVPLSAGAHTIVVQVADGAGLQSSFNYGFGIQPYPLDTTPPTFSNVSPANGSVISFPEPTLSATIADTGGSGVDASSITLILNGVSISPFVTPTDPNTAIISFTPPSPLANGPQTAVFGAKDLAGNSATVTVNFSVSSSGLVQFPPVADATVTLTNQSVTTPPNEEPPPPQTPPIYEAPTSRAILVTVQVSMPGIVLDPVITSGGGTFFYNDQFTGVSDANGMAGFGFLCPRLPGDTMVSVGVQNATVAAPLQYHFRARKVLAGVDMGSDFPGSGTRAYITADIGIGQTVVQLDEVNANGEVVTDPSLQTFTLFKTAYMTESDGTLLVPLIINDTAQSGTSSYLRATFPEFSDENGNPIAPVGVSNILPFMQPLDTRTQIISGQSQMAVKGMPLPEPIVAQPVIFTPTPGATIQVIDAFLVLPGDMAGTIEPLDSPQVFEQDPQGKSFRAQVNGTLSIKYTAGPNSKPGVALISLISFESTPEALSSGNGPPLNAGGDMVVVRIPEIRLLDANNPSSRIQQIPLTPMRDIIQGVIPASRQFLLEYELPAGQDTQAPSLILNAEDAQSSVISDGNRLVGSIYPVSSSTLPMTKIGNGTANGIIYRSNPVIATLEQRTFLSVPTPSTPVLRVGAGGLNVLAPPILEDAAQQTFAPSMFPTVTPDLPRPIPATGPRDFVGCGRSVGIIGAGAPPKITISLHLKPDPQTLKGKNGVIQIRQEPLSQAPGGTFVYNGSQFTVNDLDMRVVTGSDVTLDFIFNAPVGAYQDTDLSFTLVTENSTGDLVGPQSKVLVPVRSVLSVGNVNVTYFDNDTAQNAAVHRPSINLSHRNAREIWRQVGVDLGASPSNVRAITPTPSFASTFVSTDADAISLFNQAAKVAFQSDSSTISIMLCDSIDGFKSGVTLVGNLKTLPQWSAVNRTILFSAPQVYDSPSHEIGHIFSLQEQVKSEATLHNLMYNDVFGRAGGDLEDTAGGASENQITNSIPYAKLHVAGTP